METKRNNKPKFVSDLNLGQYFEDKYVEKRGFANIHHPTEKAFKDYDIKNLDDGKTYEVKADRKTKSTGNIFIEYKCNHEDSGIFATKADSWIHLWPKHPRQRNHLPQMPVRRSVSPRVPW